MPKKKIKGSVTTATKRLASYGEQPRSPYAPSKIRAPLKGKKK
jgi:hypothetical protein